MSFKWHGDEIYNTIKNRVVNDALLKCAADLQSKSVDRAPIDTGKLRENCVVDESEIGQHIIKVGYTREVDDYSLVQHERLDFNHPRGGEAKFLENPFNENIQRYKEFIAQAFKEAFG